MITHFFFFFPHVESIRHLPTPLFELILSQNLYPSCLPRKEANSNRSPRISNCTMRERCCSPTSQGVGLNWKNTIFCIHPHQYVHKIQRERLIMQHSKEVIYFLQLPIIQLSKKPRIPTTTISNINHPSIFRGSYKKKIQESIPQRWIPTPSILLELHPIPKTNLETCFNFESLPTISNCLPYPHSIPLSHPFCAPTPIFLPILANNYPFPKRIYFSRKSPGPLSQKGLIEGQKVSKTQSPFHFFQANNRLTQ